MYLVLLWTVFLWTLVVLKLTVDLSLIYLLIAAHLAVSCMSNSPMLVSCYISTQVTGGFTELLFSRVPLPWHRNSQAWGSCPAFYTLAVQIGKASVVKLLIPACTAVTGLAHSSAGTYVFAYKRFWVSQMYVGIVQSQKANMSDVCLLGIWLLAVFRSLPSAFRSQLVVSHAVCNGS